jgi:aspartyl-tRNA(Asn)/glutamyl-tRNA(Gln) amidotransferase subunit B
LPVLNREAVGMAVRVGIALGCEINRKSVFARKNYFYPDLPKGYQISQYDEPLVGRGSVELLLRAKDSDRSSASTRRRFRINRIHMEDDAGKSIHAHGNWTQVNLNRTGTPLIEIVTEADFRSAQESQEFLGHLRQVLLYLGVCDGNMEEGSLRCDANVSIRPVGEEKFGTKTEIKNLNSIRFLGRALDYEIERQKQLIGSGGRVVQETRLWDEDAQATFSMRSKEEAHDYRYFPEPDLLPVVVTDAWFDELQHSIPELPDRRRERLVADLGVDLEVADLLTQTRQTADYFEDASRFGPSVKVANWILGDLTRDLKRDGLDISDSPVPAAHLGRLVELVESGEITGKIAKDVFVQMYETGRDPLEIVEESGLKQISSSGELEVIIDRVLAANPDKVEQYQAGKVGLMGFFVGQVMRETRGQANPKLVNDLLAQRLKAD